MTVMTATIEPETARTGHDPLAFLADGAGGTPEARWESYAQVLLCAHEFLQIQ